MIFSDGIDKALTLILVSDKKNREKISKLIYSMPEDLVERIKKELMKRDNEDGLEKVEFNKAIRDNLGVTSMFKANINGRNLEIRLSRWNDEEEEIYDLDLRCLKVNLESLLFDDAENDLVYIGSYFSSNCNLFLGIGPEIIKADGFEYELYIDKYNRLIVEVSSERIYDKVINLDMIPSDLCLGDLVSKNSVNRLVKKRGNGKR